MPCDVKRLREVEGDDVDEGLFGKEGCYMMEEVGDSGSSGTSRSEGELVE